jgi:adenine nucleotide transporter 17
LLFANSYIFSLGIGPKVTQSAITAAFLFAFKDVLYDMMVSARKRGRIHK